MERQFGAVAFDIDSIEGYARFAVIEPHEIDYNSLHGTFDLANYVVHAIKVTTRGSVVDGTTFEVAHTGQRLVLQKHAGADSMVGSMVDSMVGREGLLEAELLPDDRLVLQQWTDAERPITPPAEPAATPTPR